MSLIHWELMPSTKTVLAVVQLIQPLNFARCRETQAQFKKSCCMQRIGAGRQAFFSKNRNFTTLWPLVGHNFHNNFVVAYH